MNKEEKIDYLKLGLKSGLEIHQQLDSHKLFCNCPSVLRSDEPDMVVKRKLHAVAGESGEVDEAAKYQASLNKDFVYEFYKDNNCLVELDEEPPKEINHEALKIAVQVALLLNCKVFSTTQIMRKTVIDGSNTSGFQRTVLIAYGGWVETSLGKVKIESVCLEEDAARIISREKDKEIFRLDRLGIPLVEIATAPDIKSPEQAKEVALHIGDVLRSCQVKRGLGTIRQDVNLSIKGGERVEIKGFQDIKNIEKTMEREVERQIELVKSKKSIAEVRNALPDFSTEFLRPMPGADRMYPETDLPLLKISRDFINDAKKTLPKLRSEEEAELKKHGLSEDMIKLLFKQNKLNLYKELRLIYNSPMFIAKSVLILPKDISSKEKKKLEDVEVFFDENILEVFQLIKDRKLEEKDLSEVMIKIVRGEDFDSAVKIEKADLGNVEEKILKIIKEKPGLNPNAYMGLVMKEFQGKVDGGEAMKIIGKFVK